MWGIGVRSCCGPGSSGRPTSARMAPVREAIVIGGEPIGWWTMFTDAWL